MFSLRKIDTNIAANTSPNKGMKAGESTGSPPKGLAFPDLDSAEEEDFKLSLHSIQKGQSSNKDWKADLMRDLKTFNTSVGKQKKELMKNLDGAQSFEERKPILDSFFSDLEQQRKSVEGTEGFQIFKQQSYNSPIKGTSHKQDTGKSPDKSPLKKQKTKGITSPQKQPKQSAKENSLSPQKYTITTGQKENSPAKKPKGKLNQENFESPGKSQISPDKRTQKHNRSSRKSLRVAKSGESAENQPSPLKHQMRLFENPAISPMKELNLESVESEEPVKFETAHDDVQLEETNLLRSRKTCEKRTDDIDQMIEVDSPIITFGQFISGQNLGNQLTITNKTNCKKTFELKLDTEVATYEQSSKQIFSMFVEDDLPFRGSDEEAVNSEHLLNCWFIENPQTRTIEKSVLFELNAYEQQTFLIIIKAPVNFPKKRGDLLSHLILTHIPDAQDETMQRVEKRIGGTGKIEKRSVGVKRESKVILCGKLENPTLFCLKGIKEDGIDAATIPLVARRRVDVQKFKLPFKNLSSTDTDFEFIFIKSVKTSDTDDTSFEALQHQVFECMTFFCQPAVLKVGNKAPSILNVQLKVDQAKLNSLPEKVLSMTLTKLLVARVKGSNLIQSFYVTINLLDQSGDSVGR